MVPVHYYGKAGDWGESASDFNIYNLSQEYLEKSVISVKIRYGLRVLLSGEIFPFIGRHTNSSLLIFWNMKQKY